MQRHRLVLMLVVWLAALVPVAATAQDGNVQAGPYALGAPLSGARDAPGPGDADGFVRARITIDLGSGTICSWLSVAIGPDGAIYVTSNGIVPGQGQVLRIER